MNRRWLQFFFVAVFLFGGHSRAAALERGQSYQIKFSDVEGRQFSLGDGRATVLTVATRQTEEKAHLTGSRVPDQYIAHPRYRFVTVINFQNRIPSFLRRFITLVVRRRFRAEADAVRPRYAAKKVNRSPRLDLFAVADFDGGTVRQLGIDPASNQFFAFVFDGRGRLINQWQNVPTREQLDAALRAVQL